MVEKYERDGKVAVLISTGYGAGWSTWNGEHAEALTFDRDIVEAVLAGDIAEAIAIAKAKYPDGYYGGASDLAVMWLDKGAQFEIEEYDGSESLHVIGSRVYMTA